MTTVPRTALQIRSLLKTNGELELSLAEFEVPKPADGEVLVRVEAAPINPSDQILLFGSTDLDSAPTAPRSKWAKARRRRWPWHCCPTTAPAASSSTRAKRSPGDPVITSAGRFGR